MGGVVLIKFPGGFRALETVVPGAIVFVFFLLIYVPRFLQHFIDFVAALGTHFRTFWHHFSVLFLMLIFRRFCIDFWSHFDVVFF